MGVVTPAEATKVFNTANETAQVAWITAHDAKDLVCEVGTKLKGLQEAAEDWRCQQLWYNKRADQKEQAEANRTLAIRGFPQLAGEIMTYDQDTLRTVTFKCWLDRHGYGYMNETLTMSNRDRGGRMAPISFATFRNEAEKWTI